MGIVTAAGSDLSVFGGTIQGGVRLGGSAEIAGGTFQGTIPNGTSPISTGPALVALPGSSVSISAGLFQGSGGSTAGAFGYSGVQIYSPSSLSISGGTFQGGASGSGVTSGAASGLEMYLTNSQTATISGGSFSGGVLGSGSMGDSLFLSSDTTSALSVSGGLYAGPIELNLTGVATTTFIGSGLGFDPSTGMLTGTLSDGSVIDSLVLLDNPGTSYSYGLAPDGEGEVIFGQAAPEPSSVVMLGIGAGAVVALFLRRGRVRAGRSRAA